MMQFFIPTSSLTHFSSLQFVWNVPSDECRQVLIDSDSREEVGHAHGGGDAVAPLSLPGLAEANVHARVGSRLVGVIVVGQKVLLEPAVFAVKSLWTQTGFWDTKAFSFKIQTHV